MITKNMRNQVNADDEMEYIKSQVDIMEKEVANIIEFMPKQYQDIIKNPKKYVMKSWNELNLEVATLFSWY